MKARDFKPCAVCGRGVAHAGVPLFYRVTVQAMGIDGKAVQRRHGLELVFGGGQPGAVLADVMGPDENIAVPMEEPNQMLICQPCALESRPLLMLAEVS